jgi:hypothetical protein
MKRETEKLQDEQGRVVAYLDGLPPIGDLRQAKVNAPRELQSPALRFGDGSQSASGEGLSALRASMFEKPCRFNVWI